MATKRVRKTPRKQPRISVSHDIRALLRTLKSTIGGRATYTQVITRMSQLAEVGKAANKGDANPNMPLVDLTPYEFPRSWFADAKSGVPSNSEANAKMSGLRLVQLAVHLTCPVNTDPAQYASVLATRGLLSEAKSVISAHYRRESNKDSVNSPGAADERLVKAYESIIADGKDVTVSRLRVYADTAYRTALKWLEREHPDVLVKQVVQTSAEKP